MRAGLDVSRDLPSQGSISCGFCHWSDSTGTRNKRCELKIERKKDLHLLQAWKLTVGRRNHSLQQFLKVRGWHEGMAVNNWQPKETQMFMLHVEQVWLRNQRKHRFCYSASRVFFRLKMHLKLFFAVLTSANGSCSTVSVRVVSSCDLFESHASWCFWQLRDSHE